MAALDLLRLIALLHEHRISFIVIGGVAAVAHGAPVLTFDLDICYQHEPQNAERLANVLRSINARLRAAPADVPFLLDADTLMRGDHFTFETDAGDFDVMATPAGTSGYEALRANAEEMDLDGLRVLVASLNDLIRMKRAANRTKDASALAHLEALREELEGR